MAMLVVGKVRQGPPSEVLLAMATARVSDCLLMEQVATEGAQSIVEQAHGGRTTDCREG